MKYRHLRRLLQRYQAIETLLGYILIALALLIGVSVAKADDVISLDAVDLIFQKHRADGIEPMITYDGLNRKLGSGLGMEVDTTVFSYLYANFNVFGMRDYYAEQDYGQFRTISLQAHLGMRVTEWMDLGYYHYSRHLMDTTQPEGQSFQQMDAFEVVLHLYPHPKKHEPLY